MSVLQCWWDSRRSLALPGLLLAALILSAGPVYAQNAAIRGRVSDETGAALPGVAISITSPALLVPQTSVSDSEGSYLFANLPVGEYQAVFELSGFQRFVRGNILLRTDFTAAINIEMKIGALEESITVSGASPVVDTVSTTLSAAVSFEADHRNAAGLAESRRRVLHDSRDRPDHRHGGRWPGERRPDGLRRIRPDDGDDRRRQRPAGQRLDAGLRPRSLLDGGS